MQICQSRRDFLARSAAAAAGAGVFGGGVSLAAEPPPEVTTIRLQPSSPVCLSPIHIAEPLLRAEGFSDVRLVPPRKGVSPWQRVGDGEVDFDETTASGLLGALDAGFNIVALGGAHAGCLELFAHGDVQTISDLKGKRIAIHSFESGIYKYLASVFAYVGLDPHNDFEWVADGEGGALEEFASERADGFLAFAPEPQELRARGIGRVILDTAVDRPWSQYLCCLFFANREWVERHPVATKRALRALLKASDFCESQPAAAASQIVERGLYPNRDLAIRALSEIPFTVWRDYDAEDTMRFFALRMYDVGLLKNKPNAVIAEGTDWRFLNELRRELKT